MKLPKFMCPVWEIKVPHMEREKFLLSCPLEENSLALSLSARRVWRAHTG